MPCSSANKTALLMSDLTLLLLILSPLVIAIGIDQSEDGIAFRNSINFLIGIVLLLALQVFLAEHHFLLNTFWVTTFWIGLGCLCCWRFLHVAKSLSKRFFIFLINGVFIITASFLVWLHPYYHHRSIRFGAPFSNANNDLAIYVISGDNFLNVGFKEFGRVVGYQAGALANFEVAGSSSLVATTARLIHNSVWRSTNLSMLTLIALSISCVYILLRKWSVPSLVALPTSIWVFSASYSRLPQQNYFLSQSISRLALLIALIGIDNIFQFDKKSEVLRGVLAVAAAAWISLVSYPAGSISSGVILLGSAAAYSMAHLFSRRKAKEILRKNFLVFIALLIPFPLLLGRWSLITSNVSLYSKANITGWLDSTSSLSDWLGIPSVGPSWMTGLLTFVICVIFFAAIFQFRNTSKAKTALPVLILLFVVFAHVVLALKLGEDAYQVWKFLATVQPIALAGLVAFITNSFLKDDEKLNKASMPRNILMASSVGLLSLIFLNVIASAETYRATTQIPSMELESASEYPITRVPNLLIRLDPYLETMIAPVILNLHDSLYASDTYLGPASPDDPRCAISHKKESTAVQVGKRLFVGPSKSCK